MPHRLVVVTATTNEARSQACRTSWEAFASDAIPVHVLLNGGEKPYLGTVPAFRFAVDEVLRLNPDAEVIACLHDDVQIFEVGWDEKVLKLFDRHPACGLAGFGGAIGLGASDMYQRPYDPMSLARVGFRSNLVDAEAHGLRSLLPERVACLDGFSQIGRRAFWDGWTAAKGLPAAYIAELKPRPWAVLEELGVVHHLYDGLLGCLAARYGWETWYLPLRAKHYGGQTAVGDAGYQAWAKTLDDRGDQGLWEHAHRIGYDSFRDVLPLRV